ncbi:MAG: hypothetical protein K0S33_639 [Bacteroidetes bacterium]|nr:hypothetical protein [Bacteroidota bacterium]
MKKLLQLIAVSILTAFIFSSCANQTSIVKRRYNNGYYVSHTSKKHAKNNSSDVAVKADKMEHVKPDLTKEKQREVSAPDPNQLIAEAAIKQANALGSEQYKKHQESVNKKQKFAYNAYANHVDKIRRIEKLTGNDRISSSIESKMKSQHTEHDVLSLFWVVLLVLLLLYLIGLLFDGFGLGWAVHIILLVLLILLILWLLRVV